MLTRSAKNRRNRSPRSGGVFANRRVGRSRSRRKETRKPDLYGPVADGHQGPLGAAIWVEENEVDVKLGTWLAGEDYCLTTFPLSELRAAVVGLLAIGESLLPELEGEARDEVQDVVDRLDFALYTSTNQPIVDSEAEVNGAAA